MASALIYIVIIGMWVAYFVPKWLSQRDNLTGKSADRFKNAIKMVSEDFSVTPPKPDKTIREKQLKSRRIGFSVVLLSLIVATVLATLSITTSLVELIPLSGFLIYVVAVRRQKVANQLRQRRHKVITQIAQARIVGTSSSTIFDQNIEFQSKDSISQVSEIDFEKYEEFRVEVKNQSLEIESKEEITGVTIVAKGSSAINNADSPSWNPIQVPAPTYLSAPKAFKPKRIIDLTSTGEWSANQEAEVYVDQYIAEQSIMPEREDGFAQDLKNQRANNQHKAAGE